MASPAPFRVERVAMQLHGQMTDVLVRTSLWLMRDEAARLTDC